MALNERSSHSSEGLTIVPNNRRIVNPKRNMRDLRVSPQGLSPGMNSRAAESTRRREGKLSRSKIDELALSDMDFFNDLVKKGHTIESGDGDNVDKWLASIFMESLKSNDNSVSDMYLSPTSHRVRLPSPRPMAELVGALNHTVSPFVKGSVVNDDNTTAGIELGKMAWQVCV